MNVALPKTIMSSGFFFRVEEKIFEVLLIPHMFKGDPFWKPPGGTNEDCPDHDDEETLDRKTSYEAGLFVEEWELLLDASEISPADGEMGRGPHEKLWFIVTEWSGSKRTKEIEVVKGKLGVPEWISVEEALMPKHRSIVGSHTKALRIAVRRYKDIHSDDYEILSAVEKVIST